MHLNSVQHKTAEVVFCQAWILGSFTKISVMLICLNKNGNTKLHNMTDDTTNRTLELHMHTL